MREKLTTAAEIAGAGSVLAGTFVYSIALGVAAVGALLLYVSAAAT